MTTWHDFLAQQGAIWSEQGITGFAPSWSNDALQTGFVTVLSDLGIIEAKGEDAATFLHNQLSNDVEHLNTSQARLAAYCSAKGRMMASFTYWKNQDSIYLQLDRGLQSKVQKRLQMFILRAKATLTDVNDTLISLGLGGAAASEALGAWFATLPAEAYSKVDNEHGTLIRIQDANGQARYQWITSPTSAQQVWAQLTQKLAVVNTSAWRLSQIQAAIPQVTDSTYEQFVPQMINFEIIGGVNFKKGCYPGQEIVARSQYLGKLKRRMSIARIAAVDIKAGAEVFSAIDNSQPCGMIVNAEQDSAETSLVLVELKLADQEEGNIHLGSSTGPALELQALPYQVIDVTQ